MPADSSEGASNYGASGMSVDAQIDMLVHKLEKNNRVLDLGSGMGFVSRYIAAKYDVQVEGINVVPLQNEYSKVMAKIWGVDHLVNVRLRRLDDAWHNSGVDRLWRATYLGLWNIPTLPSTWSSRTPFFAR